MRIFLLVTTTASLTLALTTNLAPALQGQGQEGLGAFAIALPFILVGLGALSIGGGVWYYLAGLPTRRTPKGRWRGRWRRRWRKIRQSVLKIIR